MLTRDTKKRSRALVWAISVVRSPFLTGGVPSGFARETADGRRPTRPSPRSKHNNELNNLRVHRRAPCALCTSYTYQLSVYI